MGTGSGGPGDAKVAAAFRARAGPELGPAGGPGAVHGAGARLRGRAPARDPGGLRPLPTLWAAPSPLVVGGEDATARRVVAVLGLPGTRGAALVLAVGGGGRHEVAGVQRRPQRKGAQAGSEVCGALRSAKAALWRRQRADLSIRARAEVLKGARPGGRVRRGPAPPQPLANPPLREGPCQPFNVKD